MVRSFVALSTVATVVIASTATQRAEAQTSQLGEVVVEGAGTTGSGTDGAAGVISNDGYVPKSTRTATKSDTPVSETPATIMTVTQQQLKERKPQNLEDALAYSPGVRVGAYGFNPRFDSFYIRGVDVTYNGVFRDGLRQYNSPSGLFRLEPYGLDSISVLKGPASSIYGASSSVGIIDLVSKRPTPYKFGEIETQVGSYERKQLSFDIGGPLNKSGTIYYRLTGLGRNANTDRPGVPDDRVFIAPAFTFKPNEDTELTVLSEYMYSATGGDMFNDNTYAPYTLKDGTVTTETTGATHHLEYNRDYNKFTQEQGRLGYEFTHRMSDMFSFQQRVRWSALATNERFSSDSYAGQVKEHMSSISADNFLKTEVATGPVDHTILTGIDMGYMKDTSRIGYNYDEISSPDLPNDTRQTQMMLGAYVQDELKTGPWRLLLGGRHDWFWSKYYVPGDTSDTGYGDTTKENRGKTTGRIGLSYVTKLGLTPYISYGTSFTPNSGTVTNGNTAQPTTGQQAELGVKYNVPGYNAFINASLFWLKQKDGITYTVIDGVNRQTQIDFTSRGFELEGVASLIGGFSVQASYAYTDTEITKLSPDTKGNDLNTIPKHTFSVWGNYAVPSGYLKGLGLGAGVRYVGSSAGDNYNRSVIANDAHAYVDGRISYELDNLNPKFKGIGVEINATNLLNREDQVCSGGYCYIGQGRRVIASMHYRW